MTKRDFIKFLSAFDITNKRIETLLDAMEGDFSFEKLSSLNLKSLVGDKLARELFENCDQEYFDMYLEKLESKNVGVLTREDSEFPTKLKNIDEPPFFLFYKGDLSLLKEPAIAIVGTRSPSNYGRIVTERFAETLARSSVVIVSGLAYGVDSIAHRKALDVNGKTIAVFGSGFDNVYPAAHTNLANEIAEKGLLLSEYRPEVEPSKYTFPKRNRLVAGLSDGVLITEAGRKSGTMITKDCALDNGIAIYAVPGNITSEKSEGTNEIISTMQAVCTLSPQEILRDLGIDGIKQKKKIVQLSIEESKIIELLSNGEKDIEFLSENVDFDIKKLNTLLTTLEIKSIIRRMPGGFYTLG